MTPAKSYHKVVSRPLAGREFHLKPGMRGWPEIPESTAVFQRALGDGGPLVDASGSAGAIGLLALASGAPQVEVVEPSMAALRCARLTFAEGSASVRAGLPWQLPAGSLRRLALAPPADRGTARVIAELEAGARSLTADGVLYVAAHKDQGGKRYLKAAAGLFAEAEIIGRDRGWRLLRASGPSWTASSNPTGGEQRGQSPPWVTFDAAGLTLESLPGVHAAGRLDPGTAVLVETLPWELLPGRMVLDLGCGSGVLAILAAARGATVSAADDDLAAVESAKRSAARHGLELDVRHSDVDSAFAGERFDMVLTNPPFHVGRGVRLEVPRAFIDAAARLLRPGGELWLVANRELPYERMLESWGKLERVTEQNGFKVLVAHR